MCHHICGQQRPFTFPTTPLNDHRLSHSSFICSVDATGVSADGNGLVQSVLARVCVSRRRCRILAFGRGCQRPLSPPASCLHSGCCHSSITPAPCPPLPWCLWGDVGQKKGRSKTCSRPLISLPLFGMIYLSSPLFCAALGTTVSLSIDPPLKNGWLPRPSDLAHSSHQVVSQQLIKLH